MRRLYWLREPCPCRASNHQRAQPGQDGDGGGTRAAELGKTLRRMKPGDPGGDRVDQADGKFDGDGADAVEGEFPQSGDETADEEASNDRQEDAWPVSYRYMPDVSPMAKGRA